MLASIRSILWPVGLSLALLACGGPQPSAAPTGVPTTPAPSTPSPTATMLAVTCGPNAAVHWSGAVRTDLAHMPRCYGPSSSQADGRDAAREWVDITAASHPSDVKWTIRFAAAPAGGLRALDPAETLLEYGFVFETTGDDKADYVIGLSNAGAEAGDVRVWVYRPQTNHLDETVTGPYGYPVDFSLFDDSGTGEATPMMSFFFLGPPAWGRNPPVDEIRFYAWASMTEGGEVVAWDYAPDFGWWFTANR